MNDSETFFIANLHFTLVKIFVLNMNASGMQIPHMSNVTGLTAINFSITFQLIFSSYYQRITSVFICSFFFLGQVHLFIYSLKY